MGGEWALAEAADSGAEVEAGVDVFFASGFGGWLRLKVIPFRIKAPDPELEKTDATQEGGRCPAIRAEPNQEASG